MPNPISTLLLCLGLLLVDGINAFPAHADSVEVFPKEDGYLVSGGAVLHESYTKDRDEAAKCKDCFWRIVEICKSWDDTSHGSCPWLRMKCPKNMQVVEVHRFNGKLSPSFTSADWYFSGHSCIGKAGPISTIDLTKSITETWFLNIPELQIRYRPNSNAILWQPLRYEILSQMHLTGTKTILSEQVTINAQAQLRLTCRDLQNNLGCMKRQIGALKLTELGPLKIEAQALWNASYDLLGLKDIQIEGIHPISKTLNTFNVHPLFTHLSR